MKKLLAILLVLSIVCAFGACAGKSGTETPTDAPKPANTATGKVYYLNFKPEADQAWQDLAKTYTEQTGVEVKVVTAASGEYDNTLAAEMDKDAAPTMFQIGNQGAVETWGEYALDLSDTDFVKELTTSDFNLYDGDKLVSVGYCYEAFGIIVNKALLEKAGYSLDDITNFETLKAVADDIHARITEC